MRHGGRVRVMGRASVRKCCLACMDRAGLKLAGLLACKAHPEDALALVHVEHLLALRRGGGEVGRSPRA